MKIRVSLGERSYPIVIADSYRQLPIELSPLRLSQVGCIVSHPHLLRDYGPGLLRHLRAGGWTITTLAIPESERSKSLAMVQRVVQRLSRSNTMRIPVLFALGGGVVGDLTGFVAAVFRRGVPYVQLPTTLLAQVDSAIGGKTGVDLPQGKNLVGAFYQPRLVYNNTALLRTLPMRQRRSGLAEIIKYGVIADPVLFAFLEEHMDACLALEPGAVRVMVQRSCRIKAAVVSRDERETGTERARLNFGHTLGHALETATRYRRWTHGEAIAIGMCAAAQLSAAMGLMSRAECSRVLDLIRATGLPTSATGVSRKTVLGAMGHDKKFIRGRPRWVLSRGVGEVSVTEEIPPSLVNRILNDHIR